MFNLGPMELVIILVIILIFFGSTRLPGLAKSLGQSVRSFKKGIEADPDENKEALPGPAADQQAAKSEAKETEKES